jgi:hypothetical protein
MRLTPKTASFHSRKKLTMSMYRYSKVLKEVLKESHKIILKRSFNRSFNRSLKRSLNRSLKRSLYTVEVLI